MPLLGAGVEALVLAGEVEAPVLLEVAVADHRAQGDDGFGSVQAPSRASYAETVGDQAAARALDDAGRDGPARFQRVVVAEVIRAWRSGSARMCQCRLAGFP